MSKKQKTTSALLFPDLALSMDNLQVLCGDCNHGKGNWDVTDWRPIGERTPH